MCTHIKRRKINRNSDKRQTEWKKVNRNFKKQEFNIR